MRAAGVVKTEVSGQLLLGFGHALVAVEVNLFIFDALPQSLDKNVVYPAPAPVLGELINCR